MLRDHGRSSKYVHDFVGYNFRFNEIQAAIGRVELRNIDKLNEHRREIAARYNERLEGVVRTPPERPWARHVYHMYVVRNRATRRTGGVFERQRHRHRDPLSGRKSSTARDPKIYSDLPRLPKTEEAVTQILSLPIYGDLPLEDVDYVCDAILEFFGKK